MPKKSKKFKVKVGKSGNVTLTEKAASPGKKRVVSVKVKNKELSELGGRPRMKELGELGGRPL